MMLPLKIDHMVQITVGGSPIENTEFLLDGLLDLVGEKTVLACTVFGVPGCE